MAKKLMLTQSSYRNEHGFVLVTALIMLSLLTLMGLAMFYASRSATQTSATAQQSTEAYYYAETAIHYISWALANDAEFDNFTYTGAYQAAPFGEPNVPSNASSVGDFNELRTYLWDPGPTGQAGASAVDTNATAYTAGQIMYFDNSPLYSDATHKRPVCFYAQPDPGAGVTLTYPNCIDVLLDPADSRRISAQPSMENISTKLPRYIKLEIASTGVVTPSIPSLPHQNPPVVGEDIPTNGAIIWLTAVDATNPDKDIEIFPLDPSGANGGISPSACDGGVTTTCPCTAPVPLSNQNDPNYAAYTAAQACDANTGQWLSTYGVAAYAIGYVNGKPSHLLRAVIM